jgi:cytidine deaminase
MELRTATTSETELRKLSIAAWKVRDHAYVFGNTKVGAALITSKGVVFTGCNVEHKFRSHDVHAEVNAITSMVSSGYTEFVAIVVAAERERFTPCGGCMDWIYQFGGPDCSVAYQSSQDGLLVTYRALELMPHYPI